MFAAAIAGPGLEEVVIGVAKIKEEDSGSDDGADSDLEVVDGDGPGLLPEVDCIFAVVIAGLEEVVIGVAI